MSPSLDSSPIYTAKNFRYGLDKSGTRTQKNDTDLSFTRPFFYPAKRCKIMFWYGKKAQHLGQRTRFLPSAHAANMADEKFLEFLLIRRPHVFQQKIRKSTFLSTALQKNRKRRRYRLLIVLSVLACTSTERRFWTLTRSGQWFEIVERAFTEKSGMTTSAFQSQRSTTLLERFRTKLFERTLQCVKPSLRGRGQQ